MKCQFCGHQLTGAQTKTCAKRACLLAAKRARSRARRDATRDNRPICESRGEARTREFPPELDYLDQDTGITVEQMVKARTDPALRQSVSLRRAARLGRLKHRLMQVNTIGSGDVLRRNEKCAVIERFCFRAKPRALDPTTKHETHEGAFSDLKSAHKRLDEAVCRSYGWPTSVLDDPSEIVDRLYELNTKIAADPTGYCPFRRR